MESDIDTTADIIKRQDAEIGRLRERSEILEAELRVTKKIAMQNVGEQAAEIARLRTKLADAREVLKGMDEIVARLRREKAALVEALTKIANDQYTNADECILSSEPTMVWQAVARAALRSATETKGEPTAVERAAELRKEEMSEKSEPKEIPGKLEWVDGKLQCVLNPERSGWWRFHDHYDRNGYCDNPGRGY